MAEASEETAAVGSGGAGVAAGFVYGMAEIFKLAQAHAGDDVILAFIQNSQQHYAPSGDEILYLADLGVSQNVIAALYKEKSAAPADPRFR